MTTASNPLNRKETYSGSMVIFIGVYYLLSLASSLFQTQSIQAIRFFGLMEAKFLVLSLIYCIGAVYFFMKTNPGWVICTGTLLNFIVVVFRYLISLSQYRNFDAFSAIAIFFFMLLLMAFIFLFNKETRLKFRVNNKSYLLTIVVSGLLLMMTLNQIT